MAQIVEGKCFNSNPQRFTEKRIFGKEPNSQYLFFHSKIWVKLNSKCQPHITLVRPEEEWYLLPCQLYHFG